MSSGSDGLMPARLALDTSAYSRFRAGDERVHDLLATAETVIVPAIVLGELHGAFEFGARARVNRLTLAEFLAEPFVTVAPVDTEVARRYGKIYASLRRAGRPIAVNDMWVAACAMAAGACLLTFDRDFSHETGLDYLLLEGVAPGTDQD